MNKKIISALMILIILIGSLSASGIKLEKQAEFCNDTEFKIKDLINDPDSVGDELIIGYEKVYYPAILELCGSTGARPVDWINETELIKDNDTKKYLRHVKLNLSGVKNQGDFDFMVNNFLDTEKFDFTEPNYKKEQCYEPNDPYWDGIDDDGDEEINVCEYQWAPRALNCPEAWEVTKGNSDVIVAVIDSGLDDDHEDKPAHTYRCKNIIDGSSDYDDDRGHGTHCSGVIAARMDNDVGIAGIAPNVKIMSVKVLDRYGGCTVWDSAKGIIYAARNGAWIISMSYGGKYAFVEKLACDYANNIKRVFLCAAAGNDYATTLSYPAGYTSVASVGSVNINLERVSSSNKGVTLNFVAPGAAIISTYKNNKYKFFSGTSMACPHVAGVAALYYSAKGARFKSPNDVRKALEKSAKEHDLGSKGHDIEYGWGFIDAKIVVDIAKNKAIEKNTLSNDLLNSKLFSLIHSKLPVISDIFLNLQSINSF